MSSLRHIYIHLSSFWDTEKKWENKKFNTRSPRVWWQWFHYSTNVSLGRGWEGFHQPAPDNICRFILENTFFILVCKKNFILVRKIFVHSILENICENILLNHKTLFSSCKTPKWTFLLVCVSTFLCWSQTNSYSSKNYNNRRRIKGDNTSAGANIQTGLQHIGKQKFCQGGVWRLNIRCMHRARRQLGGLAARPGMSTLRTYGMNLTISQWRRKGCKQGSLQLSPF